MKNLQVIVGAVNCVYDIFQAIQEEFDVIFPNGNDKVLTEWIAKKRKSG